MYICMYLWVLVGMVMGMGMYFYWPSGSSLTLFIFWKDIFRFNQKCFSCKSIYLANTKISKKEKKEQKQKSYPIFRSERFTRDQYRLSETILKGGLCAHIYSVYIHSGK